MENTSDTAVVVTEDGKAFAKCEHGWQFMPCEFCSLRFQQAKESSLRVMINSKLIYPEHEGLSYWVEAGVYNNPKEVDEFLAKHY